MGNKLKLVNKTGWDTRDLRRFVLAGLKAEVGEWSCYTVEVKNQAIHPWHTGWSWDDRNWFKLVIPPVDQYRERCEDVDGTPLSYYKRIHTFSRLFFTSKQLIIIAQTLAHEVQHSKGKHHKDMIPSCELPVEWVHTLIAKGFRINRAPQPKPKPKRDLQAERHAHARKMLAMHERELKKEKQLVAKWRKKVRYYDKAIEKKAAHKG